MNHLAHFLLSAHEPALLVGGFLGDFVKGRLNGHYPRDLETGIRLHRAIDAFTDKHPIVRRSCLRPESEFRRVAPIMTDIIYDYFLARHWHRFHDNSLEQFNFDIAETILNYGINLPDGARRFITHLAENRSLENYGTKTFVQRSFAHLSKRLTRANPLDVAFEQFEKFESELEQDFLAYFPELQDFTLTWLRENRSSSERSTAELSTAEQQISRTTDHQ